MLNKLRLHWPLIAVLAAGFIIRIAHLNQSLWLDEAAQALESTRPLSQQFDIVGDFQPPLYHLVAHLLAYLSHADWWLRLASVIPGLITIYYAYAIARRLFSQTTANLTTILGSLSAYHYYFSQELRPYSLAAMLGTPSMYYYLDWLTSSQKSFHWGYIVTGIAALYTTFLTPFLIIAQFISTLYYSRGKLPSLIKQQLIIAAGFVPWLPMFWQQLQAGMGLKAVYVGWGEAVSLPWFKSVPLTAIRFLVGMIRVDFVLPQIILFSAIFLLIGYLVWRASQTKTSKFILCWLLLPTLLAFLISFWIPVLEPKRLLYSLPALWILLAEGLAKLNLKPIFLCAALLVYSLPLFKHLTDPTLQREDWRSSVAFIEAGASSDSVVLFASPAPFAPYRWYEPREMQTIATGILTVPDTDYLDQIVKEALLYDTIFVYEYLMDLSDPERLIFSWLSQNGYSITAINDFRGVGFVYTFSKKIPVAAL